MQPKGFQLIALKMMLGNEYFTWPIYVLSNKVSNFFHGTILQFWGIFHKQRGTLGVMTDVFANRVLTSLFVHFSITSVNYVETLVYSYIKNYWNFNFFKITEFYIFPSLRDKKRKKTLETHICSKNFSSCVWPFIACRSCETAIKWLISFVKVVFSNFSLHQTDF